MDAQQQVLGTVKKMAQATTQTFDIDAFLEDVLGACLEISQAQCGALYLREGQDRPLTLRAHLGFDSKAVDAIRANLANGKKHCTQRWLMTVVSEGKEVIEYLGKKPAVKTGSNCIPEGLFNRSGIACRGWIGIPILDASSQAIGAITFNYLDGAPRWKRQFGKSREVLQVLADLVSEAISKIEDHHNRLFSAVRDLVEDFGHPGDSERKIENVLRTFDRIADADGSSIWLIEGTRLRCRYSTGHYLRVAGKDPDGYDLTADPQEGPIGITAWIAQTSNFVHTKTSEQEQSHPQYQGRLDPFLYDDSATRKSFLGAPLLIEGKIVGVIKSNKLDRPDHANRFFTDLDAQQFRFLSLIAAGAIKVARDMERANQADQMLIKLYEIGTRCNELTETNEILWYFLVGLTNAFGIGLNRAAWLEVQDNSGQLSLRGRMAIGPVDKTQGHNLHRCLDGTKDNSRWGLESVLEQFRAGGYQVPKPSDELQSYIGATSVDIDAGSVLHQLIATLDGPIAKEIHITEMGEKAKTIFGTLDFEEGVVFGLPLADDRRLLGFCDYVYTPEAERLTTAELVRLTKVFLQQIHLAIQRQGLRQDRDRVREKAWHEFRAATAHRIGTEVADISGALRKLKSLKPTKNSSLDIAYTRIHSSLERMRSAITEYGRLAIDRPLRLKAIDLVDLVRKANDEATFSERGAVDVNIDILAQPPATFADEEMLSYAFRELLHNAFKAINDKNRGNVTVTVSHDQGLSVAFVLFSDNGSGIPEHARDHIFDSGFYLRQGGTGQGLYIVRRYVQSHGGTVELEEATDGCTIRLCIPIKRQPPPGGVRVLVLDDQKNLAEDIHDAISERWPTFEISVVHSKEDALTLLADGSEWSLAILDVVLGDNFDRGGIDILRKLHQQGLATKAIMVSAHSGLTVPSDAGGESAADEVCRTLGAQAFIYRNRPGSDYIEDILEQVRLAIGGL